MNEELAEIPGRVLEMGCVALAQANTHATFCDPGKEYWERMAIVHAAMAGELVIKAVIAKVHPLLIFKDLFHLESADAENLNLQHIIEKGRTYNFEHLPKLLWVVTGERLSDMKSFEKLRSVRNSIQHFCAPEESSLRQLALEFLYLNIDPLLNRHFKLCAIDFHEDISVGYDYVAEGLIARELLFSVPKNFCVSEFNLDNLLAAASENYRNEMRRRISDAQS